MLSGWIGRRADDITSEAQVHTVGAICLACGLRPDVEENLSAPIRIRPFEWEWIAEALLPPQEAEGDPLSSELAQDADTDNNLPGPHKGVVL